MSIASVVVAFLLAEVALAAVMTGAWAVERVTEETGWIDAIWAFGVGATSAALAAAPLGEGDGSGWRQAVVAAAVGLWGLRLGSHIVARTRKSPDDPRYRRLIEEWGDAAAWRLFAFLQAQAFVGAVLAVAAALAAHAPSPAFRVLDAIGLLVFAIALAGESAADASLARFRADPANRGKICDVGLWRRSRHPNYFFEWLVWVALAVAASGYPLGCLAWLAAALMYGVLRYASGVTPLEEHMLRTRGDAFRAYQQKTPAFFPQIF